PLVCLHRNAEVIPVEVDDLVALESRVQLGELGECLRTRLQGRRDEALEVDVGAVALLDPRHGGYFPVGTRHVLGDQAAHATQGLAPSFTWCRGAANVLLGDAALRPGPRQRIDVDAELLRDPAHQRRGLCLPGPSLWLRATSARLPAVAADHDQHGADRDDLA